MTRQFRPADFAAHVAGGAAIGLNERCLTRLAPPSSPLPAAEARTLRFIFSTGETDRYGDRIDPAGWKLANFNSNPVCLWAHDATQPPIGRAKNVGVVAGQLRGDIEFVSGEINPLAESVYQMLKGGFLSAVSVGFAPLTWANAKDKSRPNGIDFSTQELLEISVVPIPALPSALVQARAAGLDTRAFDAWAARQLMQKDVAPMLRQSLETIRRDLALSTTDRRSAAAARLPAQPAAHRGAAEGWETFGCFLRAVAAASFNHTRDSRLAPAMRAANETDPTAGGFAVPTTYEDQLIGSLYEESTIAALCDRRQTDRPADVKIPAIDETSRADGSRWGGALSYWVNESTQPPGALPRYRQIEFTAGKLIALCSATSELIEDVPMLSAHVTRAFAAEASFKLDLACLFGSNAGTPLGILNSPGTITVAKANGQASKTIVAENVASMWSRLAAPCRRRAVWIANEDAEAQLELLGAASANMMYAPAGTGGNAFPLIKGRPVIFAEQSSPLGTFGDFVLADLSQYILVESPLKTALSMDVAFDTFQGVFRFTWRGSGGPAWISPVTPYNGGVTRSPFVALAAR